MRTRKRAAIETEQEQVHGVDDEGGLAKKTQKTANAMIMQQDKKHKANEKDPEQHGVDGAGLTEKMQKTANAMIAQDKEYKQHVLHFMYKQGKAAAEAWAAMNTVYGPEYCTEAECNHAFAAFKKTDALPTAASALSTLEEQDSEDEPANASLPRDLLYRCGSSDESDDDLEQILQNRKDNAETPLDHLVLNNFGDINARIVAEQLTHLHSLILYVEDNNYRSIWQILGACQQLEYLGLYFVGGFGSDAAVTAIEQMRALPSRANKLSPALKHLWLFYGHDNVAPANCFGHFMRAAPNTLQSLTMDANDTLCLGSAPYKGDHFAQSLHSLSLFSASKEDLDKYVFAKCNGQKMRALTLERITLDAKQFRRLVNTFPLLEHLSIETSAKGSEAAELLAKLPNLRSIELDDSFDTEYGGGKKKTKKTAKNRVDANATVMHAFMAALATNGKLELFNVSGLQFSMDCIATLLTKCPNIYYIDCQIGDFSADRLIEIMRGRQSTPAPSQHMTMESAQCIKMLMRRNSGNTTCATTTDEQRTQLEQLGLQILPPTEWSLYKGRNPIQQEWMLAGMRKKSGSEFLAQDVV